jgi:hypothetical protein
MLSDSAIDDQLSCPECEDIGQVVVVVGASRVADGVAGSTSWSGEIQCDEIGLCDNFAAPLTRQVGFGE